MPVRPLALVAMGLGLLPMPAAAQTLAAQSPAAAGRPLAFGRLLVQLEIVSTCTFDTGGGGRTAPVRCTRGVPYRYGIVDDADAAFARTQAFAPPRVASNELVRIEAQRLDVEF